MIQKLVFVSLGGAAGSMLRYLLSSYVGSAAPAAQLPWGTIAVNIVGCFIIGALVEYSAQTGFLNEEMRLLLVTGLLGGFTTFSAFSLESVSLIEKGATALAVLNIAVSVLGGIFAVYAGMAMLRTTLKV